MAKYSKKRKEFTVDIENGDGTTDVYTIREMGGSQLSEWTNINASRLKMVNGVPAGFAPMEGFLVKLVALCLFDKDGKPVPEATIASWGASTIKGLFQDCQKINGLDDDSAETEKKS